jgi:hypothetical protein
MRTGRRVAPEGKLKGRGTGRFCPERRAVFGRNQWQVSAGTGGQIGRNTHLARALLGWRPIGAHWCS